MSDVIETRYTKINSDSPLAKTDAASGAVAKTKNRISLQSILDKIHHIDYYSPPRHPHMTICMITMENGFVATGESAPADPLNYDETLGRQFAYENAVRKLWPLEAYALLNSMKPS
jgi:hypothetical protein